MSRRSYSESPPITRLHYYQVTASSPLFAIENHPEFRPVGRDILSYIRALSNQQDRWRETIVVTVSIQVSRVILRDNAIEWLDFILGEREASLPEHILNQFRVQLFQIRASFACLFCNGSNGTCYVCEFVAYALRSLRYLVAAWQSSNTNIISQNRWQDFSERFSEYLGVPRLVIRAQWIIDSINYLLNRAFAPEIRSLITPTLLDLWTIGLRQRTLISFVDPDFDHHGGGHGSTWAARLVPVAEQQRLVQHVTHNGVIQLRDRHHRIIRNPPVSISETYNITEEDIEYSDSDNPNVVLPGDVQSDSSSVSEVEREFTEREFSESDSDI
jgi:hypothetical protein